MPKLHVSNFSCIEEATIDLSPLTVLIGPQASGKSVLSKLLYFFFEMTMIQYRFFDETSVDEFLAQSAEQFRKMFPPTAWGPSKFQISFESGPLWVKITRPPSRSKNRTKEDHKLHLTISPYFIDQYNALQEEYASIRRAQASQPRGSSPPAFREINAFFKVQAAAQRNLEKTLGKDFVSGQLFVPAGRAFFTSLGKAIAAFEHGGLLDPLTITFGRFFASAREHGQGRVIFVSGEERAVDKTREILMKRLFGGDVKFEREQEYVISSDGRRIPFSALSSGQQELLPLWMTLDFMVGSRDAGLMIYIEEPEAHLFPTAQSLLMEYLVRVIGVRGPAQRMLITTHSPYILAQINNFLKAGLISRNLSKEKSSKLRNVVSRELWLLPSSTAAYAIKDKRLVSILDQDGLIDADYMDSVSGAMARQFNSLLEIEAGV